MTVGGKIISIQFLRAIASLLVLQVHLFPYLPFINKFFCGSIGVDIFFVISGYIIADSVVRLPSKNLLLLF
jgi:peptidoglycan/LPS O-acetylase OafA/YrhL